MPVRLWLQIVTALLAASLSACDPRADSPVLPSSNRAAGKPTVSDRESYLIQLSEVVVPLIWQDSFAKLTSAERTFICIWQLESEVNNGGFQQYYENSAGDLAGETPAALEAIGANRTAALVRNANDFFPGGPPPDRADREALLNNLPDNAFEELDQAFLRYEDNLSELLFKYVNKNRSAIRGA